MININIMLVRRHTTLTTYDVNWTENIQQQTMSAKNVYEKANYFARAATENNE